MIEIKRGCLKFLGQPLRILPEKGFPYSSVDTNVLVYAHDRSADDKHLVAQELIRRLWETGQGCYRRTRYILISTG